MAMDVSALADAITLGMGFSLPASTEITGFAQGVVDGVSAGTASFGGIPSPHVISGMDGSAISAAIASNAGYPGVSSELAGFGDSLATYIQSNAIVTYTGPVPPPPPGFNLGGTISGLVGAALGDALAAGMGLGAASAEVTAMGTAIADHIVANATVVNGVIS